MNKSFTLPSPKLLYAQDRPREKLVHKGVQSLDNIELISVILGSGSRGQNVTELSLQIHRQLEADPLSFSVNSLSKIKGMSTAKAARLVASLELSRRVNQKLSQSIQNSNDVWSWVQDIATADKEHLVCLSLNGAGELIRKRIVSIGTLNATLIHPREVYADVILDHAASIILIHNHPSGHVRPSNEDLEVTDLISHAGIILGIPLLDHVIVNRVGDMYSIINKELLTSI